MWVPSTNESFGTVFGVGKGKSPQACSIYVSMGWIGDSSANRPPVDPGNFIQGAGGSECAFYGPGACHTWSPVNGKLMNSVEVGVGSPQIGLSVGWTHTWQEIKGAVSGWFSQPSVPFDWRNK